MNDNVTNINLNAPIVPNFGIGNIKLGMNISNFYNIIYESFNRRKKDWSYSMRTDGIITLVKINYKGIIGLEFNTGLGALGLIEISKGYEGTLFGDVKIGSNCNTLFDKHFKGNEDWDVADGFLGFSPDLLFKIGDDEDDLPEKEVRFRMIKRIYLKDNKIIKWGTENLW